MELNSILFPAPPPQYRAEMFPQEIIWIPRIDSTGPDIPCLYLPFQSGSCKLLMYLHGNAEDLGVAYELMDHMRRTLMIHVLVVEYPGYGIYPGQPSSDSILHDVDEIFNFITQQLNWNANDIILFGRSIGSGPACWLAANRNPGALLLMSAYTSIRSVVRNVAGRVAQYLVKERFRNIDHMPNITCPTFLVHGEKDTLIPYSNSQELRDACAGPCQLVIPKDMDHCQFDFFDDLWIPFSEFLIQQGISVYPTETVQCIKIPQALYIPEKARIQPPKPNQVQLRVQYGTKYGEVIVLVGNSDALGNWDLKKSCKLAWQYGNIWYINLDQQRLSTEFKFVCLGYDYDNWEEGKNRRLSNPQGGEIIECTWQL